MTRKRVYDIYVREDGQWKLYWHGIGPLRPRTIYTSPENVKYLPCRQRAWTARDAKHVEYCQSEGFTGGFFIIMRNHMEWGLYDKHTAERHDGMHCTVKQEPMRV